MFQGLTWFGIPLEYFLRISEIFFIICLIVGAAIFVIKKLKDKE